MVSFWKDPAVTCRRDSKVQIKTLAVSNEIENIPKLKDLKRFLALIGADKDIERASKRTKKVGSSLSRKSRSGSGPLLVLSNVSRAKGIVKSLQGLTLAKSSDLSVLDLAPGSSPGRLTIWSKDSLASLSKNVQNLGANSS